MLLLRRAPCALPRWAHVHQAWLGRCTVAPLGSARSSVVRPFGTNTFSAPDEKTSQETIKRIRRDFYSRMRVMSSEEFKETLTTMIDTNPCGVFANHDIRFDQISWIGFDYDYTLVKYTKEMQPLIYDLAKQRLVEEHGYPESILKLKYDPSFPIRGLVYDCSRGNLFKVNLSMVPDFTGVYHGRKRIRSTEAQLMYPGGIDMSEDNYKLISDLFSFSTACLIADVIELFNNSNIQYAPSYIFEDIQSAIAYVHVNQLHSHIAKNRSKYVHSNPSLKKLLLHLRDTHGNLKKGLFLLSNSPISVVDQGMRHLMEVHDKDGVESWADLFDVVITSSDKPNFYSSDRPFREIHPTDYRMVWNNVTDFKMGRFYAHGSLKELSKILKVGIQTKVLYFGDHLYTDLIGPKRIGWRTAVIIKELERDIDINNSPEYRMLSYQEEMIQDLIRQTHFETSPFSDADAGDLLQFLRKERLALRLQKKAMFNKYFGSMFSTTNSKTLFAFNMLRYTDLYSSKVENLLKYPVNMAFYPEQTSTLPHEFRAERSPVPSTLLRDKPIVADSSE